ncbi:hypothetical protein A2331_07045 [Candidatus Falkowbacteria bacterium RIFOXYB2_FULL_34_18]|uniref:Uncharacterized protein n=1 Tax=Candidatus Falkowbacteria bacterium RIFOXYD2_FULL_34_120 TaxID=1798007 RepID=A0A1F5TRY9_9BACT|nr:MAG: hypothetical protein A2331_07045 [Candidatus Falkowbacteria bacterium RIFOXYB2_FULL_34_18]OGF29923.1 MAG: hypothetical protein A2500_03630 [Candidatus Falkowbacteria bacterium RIFOXYC12_FULL_34_55]OGF37219.1 MAG: hypothetical protein A2466_02885 [Candidatus Falkowbacteria bacterium RIFOXYC2_FULL_34_220]OGF39461.1 MAG: hypothetical protein A2515_04005 [Candidatus Falkowbacteria bacterium RIFOXYD12_FULL_34_57]OGF41557.1 MAG: hypothetical protein A2531_02600 [Candidatus Falkowbacteria bact
MFETSRDILNIVIAISVAGVAFFVCWLLFYFVMTTKQTFTIIREMRDRFRKVDEFASSFKQKLDHSSAYLLLIGEGVKKLVEIAKDYKEGKPKKKRKNN